MGELKFAAKKPSPRVRGTSEIDNEIKELKDKIAILEQEKAEVPANAQEVGEKSPTGSVFDVFGVPVNAQEVGEKSVENKPVEENKPVV